MPSLALPTDLYSPDQVSALMFDLANYQSALRDTATRSKAGSKKVAETPKAGPVLQRLLESSKVDAADAAGLDDLHSQLETLLHKAPLVHITLSAAPTATVKRQLADWFRSQIAPTTLMTFSVRSDIGGGFVLQAGSRVYDLSFKRQILANKAKLTEVAGRV